MQGLFEAADNVLSSRRGRDAVVTSQCIDIFKNFVSILATKQLFSARIEYIKQQT